MEGITIQKLAVILRPMPPRGFWETVWKEDLRPPFRDLVSQLFYIVVTVSLDGFSHLVLDRSLVPAWLRDVIYNVFDFLILLALAQLAIPMTIRMVRSLLTSMRKP